jgi:hypothetical protein
MEHSTSAGDRDRDDAQRRPESARYELADILHDSEP